MNAPALKFDITAITATAAEQATQTASRGLLQLLRSWFTCSTSDERDGYLSQAVDHGDLEVRMRAWDAKQQRDASFFCGGSWMC
jgi:hypothetical protein